MIQHPAQLRTLHSRTRCRSVRGRGLGPGAEHDARLAGGLRLEEGPLPRRRHGVAALTDPKKINIRVNIKVNIRVNFRVGGTKNPENKNEKQQTERSAFSESLGRETLWH